MTATEQLVSTDNAWPIERIAKSLGFATDDWEPYGSYKAKLALGLERRLTDRPLGKYIDVTAVSPTPIAVGTIADVFRNYPHLTQVLPALGYSGCQRQELTDTINASEVDAVIDASPAGLSRFLDLNVPVVRVRYQFQQVSGTPIEQLVRTALPVGSR